MKSSVCNPSSAVNPWQILIMQANARTKGKVTRDAAFMRREHFVFSFSFGLDTLFHVDLRGPIGKEENCSTMSGKSSESTHRQGDSGGLTNFMTSSER